MDGKPVPKENGGYWDHMQEMQNTLRGLRNHADTLKNVNNPEAWLRMAEQQMLLIK